MPITFEYAVPARIQRYWMLRYGRKLQVGDVIPDPHGNRVRIKAIPVSQTFNI